MQARENVKEAERTNASVLYSLRILDHLGEVGSASLTELSLAVGIVKSRVMRLCGTMESLGYVRRRADDARYVLGARLLSLGRAYERQNPLLSILRPELQKLSARLDENAIFDIIRGGKRLCLCSVSRPGRVRYLSPEGSEMNLCYGGSSKVLLAWGPPEVRAQVLAEAPYPRYTEHTITTADDLLRTIEQTRALGYATSSEERTYGTASLDVPVFGVDETLVGSLGLASTTARMTPEKIETALPLMRAAAEAIRTMIAGAEKYDPNTVRRD